MERKGDYMNISAISSANYAPKAVFKGRAEDLLKEHKITKNTPDDAVVTWGRQDSTYIYPITAGQIRKMAEEIKQEKKKVYVETTVVSDATALPARDIVQLGRQVVTRVHEGGLCVSLHLHTADASGRRS